MDEDQIASAAAGRRVRADARGILVFALSAAAVLALSLAIAWPLWIAATEARGLFNALFAAAVLAAAAWMIAARAGARARSRPSSAGRRAARSRAARPRDEADGRPKAEGE